MLVNAHATWRRRRSSHEIATGDIGDRVDPADPGAAAAERDAAWRLVAELPPRQRATLVLRYFDDLDDAAIAAILDCSPVTVRTQAMRALATLRERLAADPDGTPTKGSQR
jgi:RNA polymerase sigma factor (sigma-70 family)